jgi:uncharacterized protein YbjT (DUF2867 family)
LFTFNGKNLPDVTPAINLKMNKFKTAVILGSTGLVGTYVLRHLLNDERYHKIICLNRSKIELTHPKFEQHLVHLDRPDTWKEYLHGDEVYCCVGTTIAKAGSRQAFQEVDLDIPTNAAKMAAAHKVHTFLLVSSMGADLASANFYLETKGKAEEAVRSQPFEAIHIFRPSLLLGHRKEFRFGEAIMKSMMRMADPFMAGGLKKYRAIEAETVANAMIRAANQGATGVQVYLSDRIEEIGK